MKRSWRRRLAAAVLLALAQVSWGATAGAPPKLAHGLWIWSSSGVLQAPQAAESIRGFCASSGITEVYVSMSGRYGALDALQLSHLIALLHEANVRVEALLSSTTADESGGSRTRLLDQVQAIVQFDDEHRSESFDGIHLDIEPQQRPENKGADNLDFLPGLIDAYRAVRVLTDRHGLTLDADIPVKLLKAGLEQRRALLSSVPNLTLMLYELTNPADPASLEHKLEQIRARSRQMLQQAYEGLDGPDWARMSVALRSADYQELLPQMLAALDEANSGNAHYRGWARHSYNDTLMTPETAPDP